MSEPKFTVGQRAALAASLTGAQPIKGFVRAVRPQADTFIYRLAWDHGPRRSQWRWQREELIVPAADTGLVARQCKDIPDETVLRAIEATPGYWRHWREVWPRFQERMPDAPYNVFVAKVRRLSQRGLLHACVHDGKSQCRGDLHLPEECAGC